MKFIIAAITILSLFAVALTQSAEAHNPQTLDGDNPIVQVLPWLPKESNWQRQGDAGIYRVNGQYVGLAIVAVRDASRPVTLYVELEDETFSFDCLVTPF